MHGQVLDTFCTTAQSLVVTRRSVLAFRRVRRFRDGCEIYSHVDDLKQLFYEIIKQPTS